MAKAIPDGLKEAEVDFLLRRIRMTPNGRVAGHTDWTNYLKDVDAVILSSPTYNQDVFSSMKYFLREISKTNLKGKVGTAFGSNRATGEAIQMMSATKKHVFAMGMVIPGPRLIGKPGGKGLNECKDFGKAMAEGVKNAKEEIRPSAV